MFSYPLGGRAHIYINDHDLSEYEAKLVTDYSISGYEVTNSYNQGINRSSFQLFHQSLGLLEIRLPIDFAAGSKQEVMDNMARFNAQCHGTVELNLSDGFLYTCFLQESSETSWISDEWCTIDYTFLGIKHKRAVDAAGTSPLTIYNDGTWPENDCIITIKNLAATSNTPVVVAIADEAETFLSWTIDVSSGVYAGGDLILDGINKRNLYNAGNVPTGTMTWADYPFLRPGKNTISVSGAISSADLLVVYAPAYL